MLAAAVIPALRVYLKVAAVKKPVADIIKIICIGNKQLLSMFYSSNKN